MASIQWEHLLNILLFVTVVNLNIILLTKLRLINLAHGVFKFFRRVNSLKYLSQSIYRLILFNIAVFFVWLHRFIDVWKIAVDVRKWNTIF